MAEERAARPRGRVRAGSWRAQFPVAGLLFAMLAALYARTLCRTVGPGDSGELATVMTTWGIAHAPGFPLLSLLGNLLTHLTLPGAPALVLNLMNALFAALACAVLSVAVGVLTGERWAGFAAGIALGVSPVFWEYALALEVFSLNALFAATLLLLLAVQLTGAARGTPSRWALPLAAAVMAAVFTHHTTLVLLALPVALVMAAMAWRTPVPYGRVALAAALGLSPLLYIVIAARFDPPLNWGDPRSLGAITDFMLRRDFGAGTLVAPAIVAGEVLAHGAEAAPLGLRHLSLLVAQLPGNMSWPLLAFAALGLAWCARRGRALLALTVLFAGAVALFYSRVNAPFTPLYLGITRPFAILPHLYLAFLAGLGMAWGMRGVRQGTHAARVAVIVALALCTLPFSILPRARALTMRGNHFTRDFGANFMAGMPWRAIVFSNGDYFRNSFHYAHFALGKRPDLELVEQALLTRPWYVAQVRRRGTVPLPAAMTAYTADPATQSKAWLDAIFLPQAVPAPATDSARASRPRPVATVGFIDATATADYIVVPMGLWSRVVPRAQGIDLDDWAGAYAAVVGDWRAESLAREYPADTWEGSQGEFYPYALGSLRALLDACDSLGLAVPRADSALRPTAESIPALRIAEHWTGRRRGEYLAHQADLWRRLLTDSLVTLVGRREALFADRAAALSRAALEAAPDQLQALQTLAAVMSASPRHRDPFAEAAIRHRIVAQRPGDMAEIAPYFELVRSLTASRDPRARETVSIAEADRVKFIELLRVAERVWPSPAFERMRGRWSEPLLDVAGS